MLGRYVPLPFAPMRRAAVVLACLLAVLAVGCGRTTAKDQGLDSQEGPSKSVKGDEEGASANLGLPFIATKNTTRIAGADPIADAAGVARAVFPAATDDTRPNAVALIDARDWRAGVAGAVLASTPVRAAVLLSNGPELPATSEDALKALRPT